MLLHEFMSHADATGNDEDDDMALFRAAMHDVVPLPASNRLAQRAARVPPVRRKQTYAEEGAFTDELSDHAAVDMDAGTDWSFVRPGMALQTLRRLRRGYWKIQQNLDLHGFTRDQARQELSAFLADSLSKKYRCVRIIHGKGFGSKNREPVLKTRVGNWLMQHQNVLAFCQARPEDGGGGAILILLKAAT